jgi:hypothetical protein
MLLIRLALLMTGWPARDSEWMSVIASARILRCFELHGRGCVWRNNGEMIVAAFAGLMEIRIGATFS